jgi:hypothetical protein
MLRACPHFLLASPSLVSQSEREREREKEGGREKGREGERECVCEKEGERVM